MIRITLRFFFLLLLCCCCKTLFAQNEKIDSLLSNLKTAKEDSNKVKAFNELGFQLRTAGNYVQAMEYENSALLLAKKIDFKKGEAKAYGNLFDFFSL